MNEESGKELSVLKGHDLNVNSCNFSPCGTLIVSGSKDRTIRVWKGLDEQVLIKFAGKTS